MAENNELPMFCFQCEQTFGGKGCSKKAGVCGKPAEVAQLQDELTGAMVSLANAVKDNGPTDESDDFVAYGLFTCITNVDFDGEAVKRITESVRDVRDKIAKGKEYPELRMMDIWTGDENVRSLKAMILLGARGMAAYAFHARQLGKTSREVYDALYDALSALSKDLSIEELINEAMAVGKANVTCMKMLDDANSGVYGSPEPTEVSMKVEGGRPFIIVTGHDFSDLKELLEQTKVAGVDVYTHGEMLPAHGYPELKKYPNLKGNFGTSWANQKKEFDGVPGAILYTTNCLMPPMPSYKDRVFTTGPVQFPGCVHISGCKKPKDFSPVIKKAKELGGYKEDYQTVGYNGGKKVVCGYGRDFMVQHADFILDAVKKGAVKHIFLVGGCDGAKRKREYYTELVKKTPADTFVLTLGCEKYRFNDLDLGKIAGVDRIIDMGQCNDAYGAVALALTLAEKAGCTVNDLPLSIVLGWYEQKAVAVLLSLLSLGVKNIRLGPTLPAFVSPTVLDYLVKNLNIKPTTTPDEDLKAMLGN